ncbi:hypothetical protein OV203_33440 [Nannocystis sp. ILAH1]|uniref:hypothetical protein n=1 Tax=Nannocystis sp. ILAH1 TaxID=2996789 RepID=UPI00226D4489|nr:hypothetical protein [Nannocystis sp. ILAH1]MCY0992091.1 hypothetical protein [Nannocystis sp. ILAH1]
MASRSLRALSFSFFNRTCLGLWCLVSSVPACGPSANSTDATAGDTTESSSGGATHGTPTSSSGGSETSSGADPTANTVAESTSTATGTSSTGSVSVSSTSLETSTGPTETTTSGTTTSGTTTSGTTTSESGTSSTSTSGTGSSSTTGDSGDPVPCKAPVDCEPIFFEDAQHQLTDIESGWLFCNGGTVIYRDEALECAHEVFWPKCEGQGGECATDGDCPDSQVCANIWGDCGCVAQCMSDSDCSGGQICVCAGDHPGVGGDLYLKNTCMPANCASKADCEGECGCRGSEFFCGFVIGAFCPTLEDECSDSGDCPQDKYCAFDADQDRWTCQFLGICE